MDSRTSSMKKQLPVWILIGLSLIGTVLTSIEGRMMERELDLTIGFEQEGDTFTSTEHEIAGIAYRAIVQYPRWIWKGDDVHISVKMVEEGSVKPSLREMKLSTVLMEYYLEPEQLDTEPGNRVVMVLAVGETAEVTWNVKADKDELGDLRLWISQSQFVNDLRDADFFPLLITEITIHSFSVFELNTYLVRILLVLIGILGIILYIYKGRKRPK